jgi:polysaccharide biosynthesis transport protein
MDQEIARSGLAGATQRRGRTNDAIGLSGLTIKDYIDFGRIFRIIARKRRLIFGVAMLPILGAIAYFLVTPPMYSATTQLLIDSPKPKLIRGEAVVSGLDTARFTLQPVIDSEVEILRSAPLIERVIRKLKLENHPTFVPPPGLLRTWVIKPVARSLSSIFGRPFAAGPGDRETMLSAIEQVRAQLDVRRLKLSLIILVTFVDDDADLAALIANEIAKEYMADQRDSRIAIVKQANERLGRQLDQIRAQVVAAEDSVQKYREANNLVTVGGVNVGDRELSDTLAQLTVARADLTLKSAEMQEIDRVGNDLSSAISISRVMRSEVITGLRRQETEVLRKIATLISQFGTQHNQVERAQAELRDLQNEITQETRRLMQTAKNDFAVAVSRAKLLEVKVNQLKTDSEQRSQLSVKLAELERRSKATSDLYLALLSRHEETQAQEAMIVEDARVVAEASAPIRPYWPQKSLILAIAALAGLGLGITVVLVQDHVSPVLSTPGNVESVLGPTPITRLPRLGKRAGSLVQESTFRQNLELRQAMFELRRALASNPTARLVAVASASSGEGKTTVSANLARYAALAGTKTLLIDADLANPALTRELTPDASHSFVDVIDGRCTLLEAAIVDETSGLQFCPAPLEFDSINALETLSSASFRSFLRDASEEFGLVILDTTGLLRHANSRFLLEDVDEIVLLIEADRTSQRDLQQVTQIVPAMSAKPVMVVMNEGLLRTSPVLPKLMAWRRLVPA